MPETIPAPLIPFPNLAGNPRVWQEIAHDLLCAANILLQSERHRRKRDSNAEPRRPTIWRTAMMLYGLAAENLIKGIIVAKDPGIAKAGHLPPWFIRHNLAALARRSGLPVPRSQEHFLQRLQAFVECGKYPVGLREGDGRVTWVFSEPCDPNDALQLLEYLEEELEDASGGFVARTVDRRRIHER